LRRKGIAKQKEARPPKPKSERGEDRSRAGLREIAWIRDGFFEKRIRLVPGFPREFGVI
jgi:hypothetical protein